MNLSYWDKVFVVLVVKYWARLMLFVALFSPLGCVSAPKRQVSDARLVLISQPQIVGPCLASLLGPPTKDCIQWQPNIDAAPTFDFSRRLIFVGAGDDFLHALDADSGKVFAQIATVGRVITEMVWNKDRTVIFVGTEKAMVQGFDAFSFTPTFSFAADSKINNNLVVIDDALVFTSAVGTIYSINSRSGELNWQLKQPLATDRLRLAPNSNIVVHRKKNATEGHAELIVPHADGYLSILDAKSGREIKQIQLGVARTNSFPDIVAPMIVIENQLWVASYEFGLFDVDLSSWHIREHRDLAGISQLASDGRTLFAATPNLLMAISLKGKLLWENRLSSIKTELPLLAYPFHQSQKNTKRLFFGAPSRILIREGNDELIMATSFGSIGVFDKSNGQVLKILGNSVGFGPKIDWAGPDSVIAMSRRGLLMKFHFSHRNDSHDGKPKTAFGSL